MRKLLAVLLLAGLALGIGGAAYAADVKPYFTHWTSAILSDERTSFVTPVYETAAFQRVQFFLERNAAATEAERRSDKAGSFTIVNGSYVYWGENNVRYDVENGRVVRVGGQTVTPYTQGAFDLYLSEYGEDYSDFMPGFKNASGVITWLDFRRSASETGLNNISYAWVLNAGESGAGKFPAFTTTSQQLKSHVPYVSFNDEDESGFVFRVAAAANPGIAVGAPRARYRVDLRKYNSDNNQVERTARYDWNSIPELRDVTRVDVEIPFNLTADELVIDRATVQVRLPGSDNNYAERYGWDFISAEKDDAGVTLPAGPITLKVGEDLPIGNIVFKDGYSSINRNAIYPFAIGDRDILVEDWANSDANGYSGVVLSGKKAGTTTLSLVYVDKNGLDPKDSSGAYVYTSNITVRVEGSSGGGGSSGSNSGGGGCATGFGAMSLLLAACFAFKKR
ncbi:hypothetical protein AGMMS50276_16890 [Synergistales bacterium]|nr:hypothetical protein AGMMS50276_16890 [Synergistales bacterium]